MAGRWIRTGALVVGSALACGAGAAAQAQSLLLTGATVIDGTGSPPAAARDILVTDGRIAAVGPAGSLRVPAGARVVDLQGRFVVPGLIDTHLHGPPDSAKVAAHLAWLLANGITSARDMAGDATVFRPLAARAALAGEPLARLSYVAFWAGPSFYEADRRPIGSTQGRDPGTVPWFQAIDPSSDLDQLARDAHASGAHSLKLYSDIPLDRFRQAVAAAHRAGIGAASHVAVFPIRPREVIASGVDVVSHAALLVWEAADSMPVRFHTKPNTNFGPIGPYARVAPDDPRIVAVLTEMSRRGVVLDATVLAIARGISAEASDWSLRATALAHRLGVAISTGTDRPEQPAADRQPALFDEIELLVAEAGFTPLAAITAATLNGARAIGVAAERGTVEAGKVADLVVLGGDPTQSIRNLRRNAMVMKGGVIQPAAAADRRP